MIAAPMGRRDGVVVCVFDMAAQLGRLYGPQLSAEQQLVMRDVYARMDEVVGKAMSFVDDRTVLVVIARGADSDVEPIQSRGLAFASCRLESALTKGADLTKIVLGLLNVGPAR